MCQPVGAWLHAVLYPVDILHRSVCVTQVLAAVWCCL